MSNQNSSNEKIKQAFELLKDASKEKKVELGNLVDGLKDQAKDVKEKASIKAREAAGKVDESVHKNPWQFIGLAAVAGFLTGVFLRFRRRK